MRYLLIIIAIFSLSACMTTGTKVDQDTVSKFVKGKTTYDEVVQKLGKPNQSTIDSNGGRTISYMYAHAEANASNFIPIVGAFTGGASSEHTTVSLQFNKRNILVSYTSSEGGMKSGNGIMSGSKQ